jgi:hypothetical protein
MPSYLENLHTAREQIAANLATITAEPKPNYSIDGQSVSWQSLVESYTQQLARLDALIASAEPFEIPSQGTTGP